MGFGWDYCRWRAATATSIILVASLVLVAAEIGVVVSIFFCSGVSHDVFLKISTLFCSHVVLVSMNLTSSLIKELAVRS